MRTNFFSTSYQSIALFLRARREVDSENDIPELHELEQRVFYDASPLGVVLNDLADSTEDVEFDEVSASDSIEAKVTEDFSYAPDWPQVESQVNEVVFIDRDVDGYNLLINDLAAQSDVAVYVLDPNTDGIQQITETLQKYSQLSAVHIVSHGDEAFFEVGGSTVSLENLDSYSGQIAQWGSYLSAEADLLIYGCNVAGSDEGRELIDAMEALTGADIAASEDLTGNSLLGGNWEFEYSAGLVETTAVFTNSIMQGWMSTLDVTGYPTSNGSDNSFEHISNVTFAGINNSSGADSGGYADYSAQNANITIGQSNTLSVTFSPDPPNYLIAWIDWNQDKDFLDAGEEYIVASAVSTGGPHTINIVTPSDALAGDTIMRVSLSYNVAPPSFGTFSFGEVEDYTVTVTDPFGAPAIAENSVDGTQVVQPTFTPVTVASVLASDSSLTYDATTNKFYRVFTTHTSWSVAQSNAANYLLNGAGGQLVNVRSAYEDGVINSIISPLGSEYYTGGTDETVDGAWNWFDDGVEADRFWNGGPGGSAASGAYAPFFSGEPDGGIAENYLAIRHDGAWLDASGAGGRGSIVEWDAAEVLAANTYTLTDDAGGRFAIDNVSGEITVADGSLLDYETDTSHNVTVQVMGSDGVVYSRVVTVALTDELEPTQNVPVAQIVAEETTLTFSVAGGNAVTVSDTLSGVDSLLQVTLSVNDGVLTLSQLTGITIVEGANGSASVTINGTETDINAALDGMTFDPNTDFAGAVALNVTTSLGADLAGHYTFEGGNANDQSAGTSDENGTLVNATIQNNVDRGSDVLSLDGTRDYVEVTGMYSNPASVTLAAWINTSSATNQEVISLGDNIALRVNADGTLVAFYYDSVGINWFHSGQVVGSGWNHVAVAFDDGASTIRIYLNGVEIHSAATAGSIVYGRGTNSFIGAHGFGNASFDFNGLIDDARIYTRALSADEIVTLSKDNATTSDSVAITVTQVNDAPEIANLDGELIVVANDGGAVALDVSTPATLSDVDNPANFDGGSLQIAGVGFDVLDQLAIDTSGVIALSSGMANGSIVSVSGTAVGSLSSVSSSGFTLSFSTDATMARVESVIQSIEISSTSSVYGSRTVDYTLVDGDGVALGGTDTETASVTVNVYSASSGVVVTAEDTNYTFSVNDFGFTGISGAAFREITVTSLPVSGLLKLNGSNVTVGQTISQADIVGNLLTFEPAADGNGAPYTSFSFYVNEGNQSLSVLPGPINSYTVGESIFDPTNQILTNLSNFGDSGTVPVQLFIGTSTSTVDSTYLSQGQILFDGFVPDAEWDAGELAALDAWVSSGGVLISTNDSASYDSVSSYFGLTIGGTASSTWNIANSTHEIMNGDFGLVGNVGDTFTAAGTISYFNSSSLIGGDVVLATDSVSGEPTIVVRQHGSGWILFTADEGPFRTGMTGGGTISTANDILVANVFAWASGSVAPQEFQVDVNVSAVNDDPTNAGTLPSDITVTEDVVTNIDLSAVDFSDVDAASGALTVTLSTSTGGQLTGAAGTGITIGGTDSARTFTGTLNDLNNYFNNASSVGYVHGTLNTNGNDADTITVVINDNGNIGSGGGTDQNLGTVNVDITAVNDDPTNAGTLPSDITVTEDVVTNIDLSAVDFSDVDAASGTLTVTLSTSTGGQLTGAAGTGITIGGTDSARTFTGTLLDLNNYFDNASSISYLHGTLNTNGNDADTITVVINDNGNIGSGGGTDQNLGTVNVDISAVNDDPTNAGTLPSDVVVTEDVSTNIDLSAVDFSDVDAASGTLTVTLSTSTGGQLAVSAGTGITLGGTAAARTFTGTLLDLNNYFNNASNISYLHGTPNTNGDNADTITVVINDNGNIGSGGGTDQNLGTVNVDITAVNDDPTNAGTLPSDVVVTEDVSTNIDLSAVDFSDVDAASGTLTVTLSTSTGGQLTGAVGTGITLGGTAAARTFTGTLLDLNNYFNNASSISYVHGTPNTNGDNADTITVVINDNGNIGSGGGADQNLGTVNVDITAVNDDPTNAGTLPSDITVTEDVATNIDLSAVDFSDVDAASGTLTVTLSTSTGGQLTGAAGTGITIGGTDSARTFTGTLLDLNNYFNNASSISYVHGTLNTNGDNADTITVVINDNGNIGSGGGTDQNLGTVNVDITAVNDDPTNAGTLPSDVAVTEDVSTNIDLSAVDFSDVDAASGTLTVTLSTSTGGQLTGAVGAGITIGGTAAARTFTGTLLDLNNYFNNASNISYLHGTPNTNGDNADTITVVINDNGNVGSGGGTDQNLGTVNVDITAVNDDPTNAGTLPSDVVVTEDVATNVDLSAVDFSDVDAASGTLTVTLSTSTGGQLTGAAGTGITIGGTGSARTFTGTLLDLNNYLNNASSISYVHGTPNTNGDNADTITVVINDNGNIGSGGGTDQNLGTVNVDITAVNDDPTNAGTLPSDVVVTEDVATNVDLSAVDFSDVDAASGTLTVTLSTSTGGQLTGAAGTGITIGGTDSARTFAGTLFDLNNYFNNASSISYVHGTLNTNGNDADTITMVINDNGNIGSGGGADQNLGTVNVDITAINDDPTNAGTLPSDVVVTEDVSTNIDLSAVDFSDVDAASGTLTVTLSTSTGGQLTGAAGTGITIGGTDSARTFTGTLLDLNNYFDNASSISYVHGTLNTNGNDADTITVVINDNGNIGSGGGTDQNLGTVNVDITAVNDDPTNAGTLPSDVVVTEDVSTNIDLSAVDFSDVDAASGTLTVTLSTSTGGQLTVSAGTGITLGGTAAARTFTGTLLDLNNYFNNASNISYLHGTPNTNGDNADMITVVINDNGNMGSGGGADQNLGTVNVDITAVNDDPTNAGTLPSDVAVTEDVATNIDLSAVDFSDVDAASGTLTVALSTSTGGQLTGAAGTGITIGGTAAARTFTGTLLDLNNYFNNASNISYLHGTPNTNGDNADTITVVINDNGNVGSGGGVDQNLGTVNVDISSVNDAPITDDVIASGSEGAASIPVVLTGSDVDGTVQSFSILSLPANGTLYLDAGLTNPLFFSTVSGAPFTLYFVPDTNWNGSTSFQYSATDDLGLSDSTPATATINVTAVNDAPVASTIEGTPVNYTENDGAVQITNTISISDVDDTNIESATVQISGNYVNGQDVLAFTNTANITAVWNSVTGTLTLSGTDTLANYELALQSITYENLSEDPFAATRTVSFTVNDGDVDSNTLARNIDVVPVNDTSVESAIEGTAVNYTENDGTVQITNTISISDVDDTNIESATIQISGNYVAGQDVLAFINTASITGTWNAVSGTLVLTGTDSLANYELALQSVTYENLSEDPSAATRTVSFTVNDGDADSNTLTRDINVIPVNDNPVATGDSIAVNEGGTVNIAAPGLLGNDSDPEGSTLSAALLTGPANGVVVVNADGSYQYTHDGSETISDSFTYQISDGAGGLDTATVSISVTPVNDAPAAVDDIYAVNEGASLSVLTSALANDFDADGDPLTASLVSGPANGSLTLNSDGTFVYIHDGSETVFDSFTYQVADGNGGFDTAVVNLTINPVNDVPVALSDSYTLNEGSTLSANSLAGVQVNDSDAEGDLLTATLLSGPSNGTVSLNANGSFVYTHDGSETTTDQFIYQVDDGNGGVDNAVVILTITPVNDAPVANPDSYTVLEDTGFSDHVGSNDTDAEGDLLTYSLVSGPSFAQSFTLNTDGTFNYLPNTDYHGLDSFTYQVDDGNGGVSSVNVFITVTNVNDAPTSLPESYFVLTGELLDAIVGVLDNDQDVDGDPLIATLVAPPSNGTITFHADGTFQYMANSSFSGTDSFFYLANDGSTSGTVVEVTIVVEAGVVIGGGGGDDGGDDNESSSDGDSPFDGDESDQDDDKQDDDKLTESLGLVVNGKLRTEFLNNDVAQFKIVELEEIADVNVASRALLQLVEYSSHSASVEYQVPVRSVSALAGFSVAYDAQMLWDQMDGFAKEVLDTNQHVNIDFTLSSITSMAALGGVLWVLRGGVLMATTLSQLPTWRMIDPLTVLDSFRTTPTAGEDELGSFFEE